VRALLIERLYAVVTGVADAMGCRGEIETWRVTPAVINDARLTGRVQQVAGQLFPGDELDENERTMGSEDMAFVMDQVPGCYFFIGSANPEKGLKAAHHHPQVDFDEAALPKAAALMAAAAVDLLNNFP
jgi:metal-dependent amidase/aminoacylase/carboxypeptidase family protein